MGYHLDIKLIFTTSNTNMEPQEVTYLLLDVAFKQLSPVTVKSFSTFTSVYLNTLSRLSDLDVGRFL